MILLSVAIATMIFIVAPFEIYCKNISELTFSVSDFIGGLSLCAILLALAIFCILLLLPSCAYDFVYPAFVGVLFMLFVQSNYLNIGLNSLEGDRMTDGFSVGTYIWNTAVWVLVIAAFVALFYVFRKKETTRLIALVLSIAIFATQGVNFAVSSLTTQGAFFSAVDRVYGEYEDKPRFLTNKEIGTIGKNRNVIFFCVDRFDATLYAEPAMERYPEAFDFLDGFTYYEDAMSLYGYTFPSVGYMMSGKEYDHELSHKEYFNQVYNENNTLSVLHENGYNVHLYSDAYYDYYNANELPDYVDNVIETERSHLKTKLRHPVKFISALAKMSLYRCLPFLLKGAVGNVSSDTCNELVLYESEELGGYHVYSDDLKKAYQDIKEHENAFQTKGEKNFSFIHISGCHNADYDENWKDRTGKETIDDVLVSAKLSMQIIRTYLDSVKHISEELYTDSTIIIMGDHGKVDARLEDFSRPMLTAMFVKPSGQSGTPMQRSSAPVAQRNIWATIFQSEKIPFCEKDYEPSVFDIEDAYNDGAELPNRKFIWMKRQSGMEYYDVVEYEIEGKAREWRHWKKQSSFRVHHPLFVN